MVASPVFFRVTGQHLCRTIRDGLCDSFTIRHVKGQQNSHVAHAGHYAVSIGQLRQIVKIFPGVLNAGLSRSFQKFRQAHAAGVNQFQPIHENLFGFRPDKIDPAIQCNILFSLD
jgi:hypothetical protein